MGVGVRDAFGGFRPHLRPGVAGPPSLWQPAARGARGGRDRGANWPVLRCLAAGGVGRVRRLRRGGVGVERAEDSLPVQLAQRVADGLARRVHVVGYGRSGARTADVLAAQIPLARGGPDVSVLLVGTNDVTHVTPLHRLARGSDALLDALLNLGGPVVMSGLPEFRALRAVPHPLREAAIAYGALVRGVQRRRALIRPGVQLVDVRGAVGAEFVSEPATMSADSFHPSAAGYARIADAMAPTVIAGAQGTNSPPGGAVMTHRPLDCRHVDTSTATPAIGPASLASTTAIAVSDSSLR